MLPLGTPHSFGNQKPAVGGGMHGSSTSAHNTQEKAHLENQLRIKRLEVKDEERRLHDVEREMTQLESDSAHAEQQKRRIEGEVRTATLGVKKEEGLSKEAEQGIRSTDEGLRSVREKMEKVRHEIVGLKREIETKEHALLEFENEERKLVKQKEDFRRQYDMEYFTAHAGGAHAHEKEQEAMRYERESDRKKAEIVRKKSEHDRIRQEILRKEDDIRGLESQLRQLH